MEQMPYTVLTAGGEALELRFPLDPHTRSRGHVEDLLGAVLAAVREVVGREGPVSDGDVLQALSMALAVRALLVKARPGAAAELSVALLQRALEATEGVVRRPVGRA